VADALIRAAILEPLVERVEALADALSPSKRVIVGIAGMPGAGKTTLAEAIVAALAGSADWIGSRVAHLPMDGFHLADVELERLEVLDRKGAPQTFDPGGYAALLTRVGAGETVWAPAFERTLEQPVAQSLPITAETQIVITEGNYLLLPEPAWQQARSQLTEAWYVRINEEVRLRRLIWRHVEFGKTPLAARDWVGRSDEPNADLVRPTVDSADLVIDLDREQV
jgi:pantothenate kinase